MHQNEEKMAQTPLQTSKRYYENSQNRGTQANQAKLGKQTSA